MAIDQELENWVEITLRDAERRKCVHKVLSMDKEPAVGKGENYISDISRLKLRVQQKDGQVVDKWLILKDLPKSEFRYNFVKGSGVASKEIKMYCDVLPMLEVIRKGKEYEEPLWGECLGVKGHETLLLEDLSVKGFKMGQRRKGLDFEHCSLVMRSLSKYHALTVVLRERGDLIIDDYDKYLMQKNPEMLEKSYSFSINNLIQAIETNWEEDWKPYGSALKSLESVLKENLMTTFNREEDKFNVLNHGDCWVNNMLFKYDHRGWPISLRFLDFQASYYNSPGFDLQTFLNTSPDLEARSRTEELVHVYYDSLISNLQLYGFKGDLPSLEDIRNGLQKGALYGLVSAICMLPVIMSESEDTSDTEEVMKKFKETGQMEYKPVGLDAQFFRENMKVILRSAKEAGILQL